MARRLGTPALDLPLERKNPSLVPNLTSQLRFPLRLNSSEYGDLQEKLQAPIRNAAQVVIHQSLSDRFLETFSALVERNQTYPLPSNQVKPLPLWIRVKGDYGWSPHLRRVCLVTVQSYPPPKSILGRLSDF